MLTATSTFRHYQFQFQNLYVTTEFHLLFLNSELGVGQLCTEVNPVRLFIIFSDTGVLNRCVPTEIINGTKDFVTNDLNAQEYSTQVISDFVKAWWWILASIVWPEISSLTCAGCCVCVRFHLAGTAETLLRYHCVANHYCHIRISIDYHCSSLGGRLSFVVLKLTTFREWRETDSLRNS